MKKITSLFDFFQKVKTDDRYKEVARYGYTYYSNRNPTRFRYEDAENWIKEWVKSNKDDTCQRMVTFLNEQMAKLYPIDDTDKKPEPSQLTQEVRWTESLRPAPTPIFTQDPTSIRPDDCLQTIVIQNNCVEENCVETEDVLPDSPVDDFEEDCDG